MDKLEEIFQAKRVSTTKFREVQHGLGMIGPLEVLDANWRTREGAIEIHKGIHWINLEYFECLTATRDMLPEELSDVLHFLTELTILMGYSYTIIPLDRDFEDLDRLDIVLAASSENGLVFDRCLDNIRFAIHANLRLADLIKNKPWKQTLRDDLDDQLVQECLRGMWFWYGACVRTAEITSRGIHNAFMAKDSVNHNRVDTGV